MAKIKFSNSARATLNAAISAGDTVLELSANSGIKFPEPNGAAGEYFLVVLKDLTGNTEICKCTQRVTDTLTVERAQEGTVARPFSVGDLVELRFTAGSLEELLNITYATTAEVTAGIEETKVVSPAVLKVELDARQTTTEANAATDATTKVTTLQTSLGTAAMENVGTAPGELVENSYMDSQIDSKIAAHSPVMVVSETEPATPTEGMIWIKPEV